MISGTISENTSRGNGGGSGVYIVGRFTMSGGSISGNIASNGDGVYANTFTNPSGGGVIYGSNAEGDQANRASSDGHAVYAGNKKRNTTARAATAMDSAKNGPAGGWE
jgi:hypothetical protein